MADSLPIIKLDKDRWVDVYAISGIAVGTILEIQSLNAGDVRLHIGPTQPDDADGYELIIKAGKTVTPPTPSGIWAFSQMGGAVYVRAYAGETTPVPISIHDGYGNPIGSLSGALNQYDADVHTRPLNVPVIRHTGNVTSPATTMNAGEYVLFLDDVTDFPIDTKIQITDGALQEPVLFTVTDVIGSSVDLDTRVGRTYSTSAVVEAVVDNLSSVAATMALPQIYELGPPIGKVWHIYRFLPRMIHSTAADDSKFGDLGALQNGYVFRVLLGDGTIGNNTNWKTNGDIAGDAYNVDYTDKSGSGDFGTKARASIKDGSGAIISLDGGDGITPGDKVQVMAQDATVTGLVSFSIKFQGHEEGA